MHACVLSHHHTIPQIDTVDKGGTFLGTLRRASPRGWVNVGIELLEAGFASLHPTFAADRAKDSAALVAAEAAAKSARKKIWEDWKEPTMEEAAASGSAVVKREATKVTVTEVRDGVLFYTQPVEEPRVAWLAEQLARLSTESTAPVCGDDDHLFVLTAVCNTAGTGRGCAVPGAV